MKRNLVLKQASSEAAQSRRTALAVTGVKILLLAALAPPVVVGLALRAGQITDSGWEQAQLAALAGGVGPVGAVLGALIMGRLSDTGGGTQRTRWGWVLVGAGIGSAGLVLVAVGPGPVLFVTGWVVAQAGMSGAVAVTRSIMATTQTPHLRRGTVGMVLGAYLGLFIPLLLLLLFPSAGWPISVAFAVASIAAAACASRGQWLRAASAGEVAAGPHGRPGRDEASTMMDGQPRLRWSSVPLGREALLAVQFCFSASLAAFLTFHPLDVAAKVGAEEASTRVGTAVLTAALLSLIAAGGCLLRFPAVLAHGRGVMVFAGTLLALGLLMRAAASGTWPMVCAAVLSGAAVAGGASAILSLAMESAPPGRRGRHLGVYSAAGSLGHIAGPPLGLLLIGQGAEGPGVFDPVFAALGALSLTWASVVGVRGLWLARRGGVITG
ncbi:hypothetical protein GCM10027591_00820 [Zhihengliuella somnathii]